MEAKPPTHHKLSENLQPMHFGGRTAIKPEKKIAMFLKYIGSTETILDPSELFGVCEATMIRIRRQITDAIISELLDTTIQWPNVGEYQNISAHLSARDQYNFPDVIGALDGSHIPISKPYENPDALYNRKKFHFVVLQAVCREDLRFTDICVGYPGRMHDSTILKASDIWNTGRTLWPNVSKVSTPYWLMELIKSPDG